MSDQGRRFDRLALMAALYNGRLWFDDWPGQWTCSNDKIYMSAA